MRPTDARKLGYVLVAAMVVLAGCGVAGPTTTPDDETTDTPTPTATATPTPSGTPTPTATPPPGDEGPADPETDALGWENGYWYNESLSVQSDDGLNRSELDKVVSRSMARVEKIRELEFQKDVPVEIITREEFADRALNFSFTTTDRIHQNVKWEATFMVNETTSAVKQLKKNYAASVLGYYSPTKDKIVVVSPEGTNGSAAGLDEFTLSHELAHAIQDQHFNITKPKYHGNTTEANNAVSGLIEGDASYTEYLYKQKCKSGEWDCLNQPDRGSAPELHVGLFVVSYVPYSEGTEFVKYVYERKGWAGVNALYENPPVSTEQLIHPAKYPEETPVEVSVADTSSNGWHVLDLKGPTDHASFGEAGLYAMMWYQSFEASTKAGRVVNVVVDYRDLFEYKSPGGELEDIGAYDYGNEVTDGWAGDRLVPYVKGEATTGAPTGYVWKIEWDTVADAEEFLTAYMELLDHRGAKKVDGRQHVWRIPDEKEFSGAYYVKREGTTIVIVHAPDVEDLGDVHRSAGS